MIGIGVDLVEVARIKEMMKHHGRRFINRVFTEDEAAYCRGMKRAEEHYAARFAAKEAALKALGIGMRKGIAWKDIEVVIGEMGQPGIRLTGGAEDRAEELGVANVFVSLSHTKEYAVAHVLMET
jgi:holo-[acyl-carrier protein] synthase